MGDASRADCVGEMVDIPLTAHLIGGCVIGDSADPGVVDPYHRMFGHPGLHVVDGSAISANLGVNPALTITALAERAMSMWPNKGEADPRPPLGASYGRLTPVPPRAPAVPAGAPAVLRLPVVAVRWCFPATITVGRWCGHVPRRCGRPWSPIPAASPSSGEVIMTSDAALAPPEIAALDRALDELTAAADQWRRLALAAKRDLLRECGRRVSEHAPEWVAAACAGRGVLPDAPIAGEEWVSGPWVTLAYTNALAETVGALARGDDPLRGVRLRANGRVGQTVVDVLPHDAFDRVLMSGFRVEVWMEAGATVDRVLETAGAGLTRGGGGGVALVLGAGNISSIAPLDVLYKLYAGNQVVILKPSPVVAAMTLVLRQVLAPFIERGFVRIAAGGAEVGRYLTEHPQGGVGAHDRQPRHPRRDRVRTG